MRRHRDSHDLDPASNAAHPTAAGKRALTDDLPVQRKAAVGAPPQLGFTPPAAGHDDPFGLHVQMKGNGKAKRADDSEELLDALSEKDVANLQVVTAGSTKTPPLLFAESTIKDVFPNEDGSTDEPKLDDVEIVLASNVDDKLEEGIENIVGKLSYGKNATLLPNTTMTLLLDLRPVGGPLGTFRFTYVDRPDKGKGKKKKKGKDQILVELVSTGGNDTMSADKTKEAKAKFKAHGFKSSGYSTEEAESLCHAVLLVPDAALSKIDGATFQRAGAHKTNPNVGGEYDEAAHTITMYDKAFVLTVKLPEGNTVDRPMRQLGSRNVAADGTRADESVRLIAHEIGHAIDHAPMRDGSSKQRSSEADHKKVKGEFRDAVTADGGARLTDYAETGMGEQYAEAFSLYVTDPKPLEKLRPNVFAYFQKQFAPP